MHNQCVQLAVIVWKTSALTFCLTSLFVFTEWFEEIMTILILVGTVWQPDVFWSCGAHLHTGIIYRYNIKACKQYAFTQEVPCWAFMFLLFNKMFYVCNIMDLFDICVFLSSRSRHIWVILKSNDWESTTNILYIKYQKKNSMIVFSWQKIERLITAVRRENDVKCTIPLMDTVLETPSC